jgi:type III restriction enzyme
VAQSFFERPILNSPYEAPRLHHALDAKGQPLDVPPIEGRRRSELISPVPKPRKRKGCAGQGSFVFGYDQGLTTEEQEYNPGPIINEIRQHLETWRSLPNPADWGVTPATALKAEIDEDAWASLYRDVSRPFPRPGTGRIAVKVINHFGDEVMKVFGV